jgi:hypothetical protein
VNLPKSRRSESKTSKRTLLETIQMHRGDTSDSCEQFQDKIQVGTRLDICTTIGVTTLEEETNDLDEGGHAIGEGPDRVRS